MGEHRRQRLRSLLRAGRVACQWEVHPGQWEGPAGPWVGRCPDRWEVHAGWAGPPHPWEVPWEVPWELHPGRWEGRPGPCPGCRRDLSRCHALGEVWGAAQGLAGVLGRRSTEVL